MPSKENIEQLGKAASQAVEGAFEQVRQAENAAHDRKGVPHAIELEQMVLGAVILERDAFMKVNDVISEESFYDSRHQHIFMACKRLSNAGRAIDLMTVTNELRAMRVLESTGGPVYLVELTGRITGAANIEYHAHIIQEKHMRRRMMQLSDKLKLKASRQDQDVLDTQEYAEQMLLEISGLVAGRDSQDLKSVLNTVLDQLEAQKNSSDDVSGIATGITKLDELTAGLHPAELVVIGARPSMGKTAFALHLALQAAQKSVPVAIFTLEMSAEALAKRILGQLSGVNSNKLRSPKYMREEDWHNLAEASAKIAQLPITIDDTPALSVYDLRAKARRLVAEKGIQLVLVDYLQLMTGQGNKNANRENEISQISRGLKLLAKEINAPVVALAQLNRAVEARPDKRPMLSDLRESGAIEQDADLVMFLYRAQYYGLEVDHDGESTANVMEIILGKQRNGATGNMRTHIDLPTGKISNWQGGVDWQKEFQQENQKLMKDHMNAPLPPPKPNQPNSDDDSFDAPF